MLTNWSIHEECILLHDPCAEIGEFVEKGVACKFGEFEVLQCMDCGALVPKQVLDALSFMPHFGFGCWSETWKEYNAKSH